VYVVDKAAQVFPLFNSVCFYVNCFNIVRKIKRVVVNTYYVWDAADVDSYSYVVLNAHTAIVRHYIFNNFDKVHHALDGFVDLVDELKIWYDFKTQKIN